MEEGASSRKVLIRVKRRRSTSPVGALFLCGGSKRARLEARHKFVECAPIFKFAGTAEDLKKKSGKEKDEKSLKDILNESVSIPLSQAKPEFLPSFSRKSVKDITKEKNEMATGSKNKRSEEKAARFTLVQSRRNMSVSELIHNSQLSGKERYDVVTLEPNETITCNDVALEKSLEDENYIYDIYCGYTNHELLEDEVFTEAVGYQWESMRELLVPDHENDSYGGWRQGVEESDDSNSENNWRNEYPDQSDSESDVDVYDCSREEENCENEVVSLADDSEDEGLLHTRSVSECSDQHGSSYARFKRQVLKEMGELGVSESDEDY